MCRYPCALLGDRNKGQEVVFPSAFHLLAKHGVITFHVDQSTFINVHMTTKTWSVCSYIVILYLSQVTVGNL